MKHYISQFEAAETKCRFDCEEYCPTDYCFNVRNPFQVWIWKVADTSDLTPKDCERLCGT